MLEQERQQEGHRADAGAVDEAADDSGAHGRDGEQREVEHRRGSAPRMQDIGIGRGGAEHDQAHDHAGRKKIEPEQGAAERESTDAKPGKHCPKRIERVRALGSHILDEDRRQDDADKPDRDVDQENPMPRDIGRDESTESGPDQRTDQRRQRDPDHGID
jgi:hypothetical protein